MFSTFYPYMNLSYWLNNHAQAFTGAKCLLQCFPKLRKGQCKEEEEQRANLTSLLSKERTMQR